MVEASGCEQLQCFAFEINFSEINQLVEFISLGGVVPHLHIGL